MKNRCVLGFFHRLLKNVGNRLLARAARSRATAPLALLFVLAAQGRVVITPSKGVSVASGGTVHFKANVPVKWSLTPGSAGSIDENGDYHAPASIPVNDNLAGCQLLPNDHVLNTRIDSLPVNAKSAEWFAKMPVGAMRYSPSWGFNIGNNSTPAQAMHFLYTPDHDGRFQIPSWPNLKRENGVFSDPTAGVDRHVVTLNRESCTVFELYNNYTARVSAQCPSCTAQSGVAYSTLSYELPTASTDAAGLFLAPLTLRLDEIQAGIIKHALRVTLRNNFISPSSTWPSTAHAGAWGFIPYGTRFRLKAGYDTSHFSATAKVLLTQLKEYGLLIADGGLDWDVQAATDVLEDWDAQLALEEMREKGPRSSDLEAVDESALMVSASSGRVNPLNRFVKPVMSATVIATELKNSESTAEAGIILRGITVGVPDPAIWIQSGVETKLDAWVNGTENKELHWSLSPAGGEVSSEGIYKAPKVQRPTAVKITVTSAADANAKTVIAATVMPPGSIRINVGGPDYGPDSGGHMWWRDQASESNGGSRVHSEPGDKWRNDTDIGVYRTARYAIGDMVYQFLVPNGNYVITLMIAHPGCQGTFDKKNLSPVHLEAQGQVILRDFDFGESIHHACLTPVVEQLPAAVTNNRLEFALRSGATKEMMGNTLLNGFVIAPDNDAPHLTVAPATAALTTGEERQFYAVRWFARGGIQWSLEGPGTLSSAGLYKAPTTPALRDEAVSVAARTIGDAPVQGSANFRLKPGDLVLSPESVTVVRSLSQQFKSTFGAVAYSNLQWSVTPALGSISATGVYTAPDKLGEDTRVTINAQSKDDPRKSATARVLVKAAIEPIRIRCGGGPAIKDARGNIWSTDYGYSSDTVAYGNPVPIAGTTPDMQPLYQYARYRYQDQPFNFHFDVPNGRYAVTLKFADYGHDEAGHFSFDVGINGKKVLTNFDPDVVHGPKAAVDEKFEVNVLNRQIRIDFLAHKDAAFINGIEIVYLGP